MAIVREIRIALRDAVPRRDEAKSALLLECPMGAVVCTEVPALVHVLLRAWRGLGARTGSTVRILLRPRLNDAPFVTYCRTSEPCCGDSNRFQGKIVPWCMGFIARFFDSPASNQTE